MDEEEQRPASLGAERRDSGTCKVCEADCLLIFKVMETGTVGAVKSRLGQRGNSADGEDVQGRREGSRSAKNKTSTHYPEYSGRRVGLAWKGDYGFSMKPWPVVTSSLEDCSGLRCVVG